MLGGLLAGDIALPVPSSLVSTSSGALLGFWPGLAVSWLGMMGSCWLGYGVGARAGEAAVRRMAGEAEVSRLSRLAERHGPWFLLVFRAVPVLAEVSVVFGGVSHMRWRSFLVACALSNLGISATYAALGTFATQAGSLLLCFGGMVLIPGAALWLLRQAAR